MLQISNLHVSIKGKIVLQGLTLTVEAGECHAVMGPNGSGKSTLAHVIAGHPDYQVTDGTITYNGEDLLAMDPEMRARFGVFVAFQNPIEIPGVNNAFFIKAAVNAVRKHRGEALYDAADFLHLVKEQLTNLEIGSGFLERQVNVGFSGGERKKNETLQMLLLEPYLAILDETDSGLDIDALKIVAHGINSLRTPDRALLIITHYHRLLELVVPDVVHVLSDGQIIRSGGNEIATRLEEGGYVGLAQESHAH